MSLELIGADAPPNQKQLDQIARNVAAQNAWAMEQLNSTGARARQVGGYAVGAGVIVGSVFLIRHLIRKGFFR